jgi:hypothetical protein
MLNFYINRAGRTLSETQQRRLEAAKDELRALYDRPAAKQGARRSVRKSARAAPRRSRS